MCGNGRSTRPGAGPALSQNRKTGLTGGDRDGSRRRLLANGLAGLLLLAAPAARGETTRIEALGLNGYDPVSYFMPDGPRGGSARFELPWNGQVWRFALRRTGRRSSATPRSTCRASAASTQPESSIGVSWRPTRPCSRSSTGVSTCSGTRAATAFSRGSSPRPAGRGDLAGPDPPARRSRRRQVRGALIGMVQAGDPVRTRPSASAGSPRAAKGPLR